jgi:predicted GIY-YIG superfamily endonuclease
MADDRTYIRVHKLRAHQRGPLLITAAAVAVEPGQSSMYRLKNWSALLYVGASQHPWRRLQQHANDKPWWWEVTEVEQVVTPSHGVALQLEDEAIHTERPLYNRTGPWALQRKAVQRRGLPAVVEELVASMEMPA